ncbi:hypothetical protein INT47_005509 [Mucor saturninus]|uniref:Uncharacterized protein n=1 Tax=Mucor saturninus TaxID=64648 RepID=A0A8H7RFD5_9FUNG|nr:hypothetical protein INT47_005509 [Mucor saturninus]
MRAPIYPEIEAFIQTKKLKKYESQQQETASETINKPNTPEEKKAKSDAKKARNVVPNTSNLACKSCGQNGHASARSRECLNYNYTVKKLIQQNLGSQNQRYTVSIPPKSFMSSVDENANNTAVEKIKSLSMFLRKVAYNAQIFVKNFYVLKHPNTYSVCRVVHRNLSVQNFQSQYPLIPHLAEVWEELNGVEGVNLTVEKGNLKNFKNIIANYFIYMIRQAFHKNIKMPAVKKHIVYEHVLNVMFFSGPGTINSDNISISLNTEEQENICAFLNPLILEIKNRIPAFPVTKATLNNAPFSIMPVFKHILEKYESLIVEAPLPFPVSQVQIIPQLQLDETDQVNKRPRKNNNDNNGVKRDFQPPRLFSLLDQSRNDYEI